MSGGGEVGQGAEFACEVPGYEARPPCPSCASVGGCQLSDEWEDPVTDIHDDEGAARIMADARSNRPDKPGAPS